MLSLTALAAVAVFAQEATHAPAKDPAKAAFEKTLKKFHDAAAMHVTAEVKVEAHLNLIGQEPEEGKSPFFLSTSVVSKVSWAKPDYGTIQTTWTFHEQGQEESYRVGTIGTQQGIYTVDHDEKSFFGPHSLLDADEALIHFVPFSGFLSQVTDAPADLKKLPAVEGKSGLTGWSFTTMDGATSLWMKGDTPVSMEIAMKEGEQVVQRIGFKFSGFKLLEEADPKEYIAELPKDYVSLEDVEFEEPDFGESLLAIGADVPNVKVSNLDGSEVSLASLKGKTVLLNFWFYH